MAIKTIYKYKLQGPGLETLVEPINDGAMIKQYINKDWDVIIVNDEQLADLIDVLLEIQNSDKTYKIGDYALDALESEKQQWQQHNEDF